MTPNSIKALETIANKEIHFKDLVLSSSIVFPTNDKATFLDTLSNIQKITFGQEIKNLVLITKLQNNLDEQCSPRLEDNKEEARIIWNKIFETINKFCHKQKSHNLLLIMDSPTQKGFIIASAEQNIYTFLIEKTIHPSQITDYPPLIAILPLQVSIAYINTQAKQFLKVNNTFYDKSLSEAFFVSTTLGSDKSSPTKYSLNSQAEEDNPTIVLNDIKSVFEKFGLTFNLEQFLEQDPILSGENTDLCLHE